MHSILCILFYALYSMHHILCIIFYALYTMHCISFIVFYYLHCSIILLNFETRCNQPTDPHTDRQTAIVTYRAAIAANKRITF